MCDLKRVVSYDDCSLVFVRALRCECAPSANSLLLAIRGTKIDLLNIVCGVTTYP